MRFFLPEGEIRYRVALIDFGHKENIIRCLLSLGCAVTVLPAEVTAEEVLAIEKALVEEPEVLLDGSQGVTVADMLKQAA